MLRLLEVDDPDVGDGAPGFYGSPSYGAAVAEVESGRWMLADWDGGVIRLAFILRAVADTGYHDITSPYGYPVLTGPGASLATFRAFRSAFSEALRDLQVVAEFLRFSPFDDDPARMRVDPAVSVQAVNEVFLVDVSDGFDGAWQRYSGRIRTAVRKARSQGLEVAALEAVEAVEALPAAAHLYRETMRRVGADPYYLFADEYFHRLHADPAGRVRLLAVRDPTGELVAAAFALVDGQTCHYHLSGSLADAGRSGATTLLVSALIESASSLGCTRVNLGGGLRPGDALAFFKAGFTRATMPFVIGRAVHLDAAYGQLVARRAQEVGVRDSDSLQETFPRYRALANEGG
jgi:hypothetical protein